MLLHEIVGKKLPAGSEGTGSEPKAKSDGNEVPSVLNAMRTCFKMCNLANKADTVDHDMQIQYMIHCNILQLLQ